MTEQKSETATETKVRNCIVAVDGSDHADYAFEWFLENIHRPGDHVVLVYVPELNDILHSTKWTTSAVYQFDKELMDAMLKEEQARIRTDLDKFAKKLKEHGLGGKVKSVMASKPGEGIIKAAKDEKEPGHLIVVGSRGLGQLRRTFMGSVSDYVVHHSHIPVFVCKHPSKHIPGIHEGHKKSNESSEDKTESKEEETTESKEEETTEPKEDTKTEESSEKKEEASANES